MTSGKSKDRRDATRQQIEHMLEERTELLALLIQVSNLNAENMDTQDKELLQEFCQLVTDYVAAGHFGLYGRVAEGKERRHEISDIANSTYPQIEKTTQQALEFSEKYSSGNSSNYLNLANDLSRLGVALTSRIELEDKLISRMLA